jgi:ABC-type amino acid transport system permease subunit
VDGLLVALLGILVVIATPIVVIFIILAGFKYVTAQGDTNKLQEAKRALVYAIIGGVLIIGAEVLAEIIRGTVDSFR